MIRVTWILLSLLIYSPASWADLSFDVRNRDLSVAEKQTAQQALSNLTAVLPTKIKKNLGKVKIHFIKTHDHHAGKSRRGNIYVNRNLLNKDFRVPQNISSRHKSRESLLHATFIHELGHLYDLANIHDAEKTRLARICRHQDEKRPKNPDCDFYRHHNRTSSTDPGFLRAAGWWYSERTYRIRPGNFLENRSPDRYEYKNPAEAFAVNLEYFLMDPEFQCRRPTLQKYLAAALEHQPFPEKECSDYSYEVVTQGALLSEPTQFAQISPSRVYAVHWLHAGKGRQTMSSFGHSMLRFIVCAPGKPLSENCLKDIKYHVVLNYRASVDQNDVSYLEGLTGKYPTSAYFSDFFSVLNEYTRGELRELHSYPLILNREEIRSLLDVAIETHWTYEGRYYFITSNCATETLAMLKKALPQRKSLDGVINFRPDTLVQTLERTGNLFIPENLQPPYFYASKVETFAAALARLKTKGIVPTKVHLGKLHDASLQDIHLWTQVALKVAHRQSIADMYLIAHYHFDQYLRQLQSKALKSIEDEILKVDSQDSLPGADELSSLSLAFLRTPGYLLPSSGAYGRPLKSETQKVSLQLDEMKTRQDADNALDELQRRIDERLSPYAIEIELGRSSLSLLRKGMGINPHSN